MTKDIDNVTVSLTGNSKDTLSVEWNDREYTMLYFYDDYPASDFKKFIIEQTKEFFENKNRKMNK